MCVPKYKDAKATPTNYRTSDFLWTSTPNSHVLRRKVIIKKRPNIIKLQGCDRRTGIISTALFVLQLALAHYVSYSNLSWGKLTLIAYIIGGTITHSNFAAIHELSHDLVWDSTTVNMIHTIMLTISMAVPLGISFRRHLLDHHVHFGVDGKDPDIPGTLEGHYVQGRWTKLLSILLLPFGYLIRPVFVNPKRPNVWEGLNVVVVMTTNFIFYTCWGCEAFVYLLLSCYFALSIHPLAGHFISEHYLIYPGLPFQESFSYYGILNKLTYNFGYHVEHHDFPNIPGSRLPQVKKQAAEFYDLPTTPSWPQAMIDYVMTDRVTAFSRIKRVSKNGGTPAANHALEEEATTTRFLLQGY